MKIYYLACRWDIVSRDSEGGMVVVHSVNEEQLQCSNNAAAPHSSSPSPGRLFAHADYTEKHLQ